MKKKLLTLFLAIISLISLNSCAKKMDYGQVIYFASQTYSDSQINYGKCKSILTKNVKKAEGYFEDYFKVGENICKNDSGFEEYKFQKYSYNFNDSYSFKVIGKKITVSRKIDAQTYFSKTISSSPSYATSVYGDGLKEVYHFNDLGLLSDYKITLSIYFNLGSKNGSLNYVETLEVDYIKIIV